MPMYEYRCQNCGEIVEAIQSFSAAPLTTCEACGGELKRLISRSAFHLKGGGWYTDHYGLKSSDSSGSKDSTSKPAPASEPAKSSEAPASPKSESSGESAAKPATETKGEAKGKTAAA
jgi:putative FmdB family regulatory protein